MPLRQAQRGRFEPTEGEGLPAAEEPEGRHHRVERGDRPQRSEVLIDLTPTPLLSKERGFLLPDHLTPGPFPDSRPSVAGKGRAGTNFRVPAFEQKPYGKT